MSETITLPPEQVNDINLVLEIMAAAPFPLNVHERGRAAVMRLAQALMPKAPEAPPEAPAGPQLVV